MRVESMAKIDYERYDFDFDLTFALVLMAPDGTILHTVGGRDYTDAESHLSMTSLVATLRKTLVEHRAHRPASPRAPGATVEQIEPAFAAREKRNQGKQACVHCHEVHDLQYENAVTHGTWKREHAWRWPDPREIGITLDRNVQQRVVEVARGSAAAAAGLRAGDVLTRLGSQAVLTFGDVQRALHRAPRKKGSLSVAWTRDGEAQTADLKLATDWKTPEPLVFSWRSTKWLLPPQPGFGGTPLRDEEKAKLGLPKGRFAFRIGYLVTWGPRAHTGRAAAKAGLRKGDVVTAIDGRSDFRDMHHFHAWVRLTRKPGETLVVRYVRKGKPATVQIQLAK